MDGYRGLKVVVTGGAGFIGSHIVERCLDLGARVTVIDNFHHGNKIEHLKGHDNLCICEADISDTAATSQALQDTDICFHLAAIVGVEETQTIPLKVLQVEIQGTIDLLNIAVKSGVKRTVFASSSEVYGDLPYPMKEDGPFSPKSDYAVAKLVGERYCRALHHKYDIDYTILRYFNVYGPRQDKRFVIPRFVMWGLTKEPLVVYGNGKQTRDFTYIDDAVNMSLLAAIRPEAACQEINIGTGVTTSIEMVALLLCKILNGKNPSKLKYVDYDTCRPPEIEISYRVADITKGTRLLQYQPKTSLESGINKYIDWYLKDGISSRKIQHYTSLPR